MHALAMFAALAWVGGVLPAHAMPPLGCLQNAAGARWCDGQVLVAQRAPVHLPVGWVHPATVRRAPRPFDAPEAIVQALPVDALVRSPGLRGEGVPSVAVVPRDAGKGISEVRTMK